MLVIRRRAGEAVLIGDGIEVRVLETSGGRVTLGITAPKQVPILREEIRLAAEENAAAARAVTPAGLERILERWRGGEVSPSSVSKIFRPLR